MKRNVVIIFLIVISFVCPSMAAVYKNPNSWKELLPYTQKEREDFLAQQQMVIGMVRDFNLRCPYKLNQFMEINSISYMNNTLDIKARFNESPIFIILDIDDIGKNINPDEIPSVETLQRILTFFQPEDKEEFNFNFFIIYFTAIGKTVNISVDTQGSENVESYTFRLILHPDGSIEEMPIEGKKRS